MTEWLPRAGQQGTPTRPQTIWPRVHVPWSAGRKAAWVRRVSAFRSHSQWTSLVWVGFRTLWRAGTDHSFIYSAFHFTWPRTEQREEGNRTVTWRSRAESGKWLPSSGALLTHERGLAQSRRVGGSPGKRALRWWAGDPPCAGQAGSRTHGAGGPSAPGPQHPHLKCVRCSHGPLALSFFCFCDFLFFSVLMTPEKQYVVITSYVEIQILVH